MAPVRAGLTRTPPIAGAILAGGSSVRFGSDKALAQTPSGPLARIVASALRSAGVDPIALIGGSAELSAALSVPSVADRLPGEGPLAGLATALSWASGVARVVVVPCDMPAVTPEVIRALIRAGDNATAVVARLDRRPHPIVGCWPTQRSAAINALLRSGERRMRAALDTGPYVEAVIDAGLLADADDPEQLTRILNSQGSPLK